jgi:hypothetical protein
MTRRKKMMRTRMTSDWLLVYLDRLQNLACRIGVMKKCESISSYVAVEMRVLKRVRCPSEDAKIEHE